MGRVFGKQLADFFGTGLGAIHRSIDFQIVDPRSVDLFLPCNDRRGDGLIRSDSNLSALSFRSFHQPPLQHNIEGAAYADEQDGQTCQKPGAVGENAERLRIAVVMTELGDDIQPHAAMRGDRRIECGIKARNQRLEIRPLAAGTQADTRTVAWRRDMPHIGIDAEIEPNALEISLYHLDDAAFSGSRRAVENDDLTKRRAFASCHESNPFCMLFPGCWRGVSALFDWTDAHIAVTDSDRGEIDRFARNGSRSRQNFDLRARQDAGQDIP